MSFGPHVDRVHAPRGASIAEHVEAALADARAQGVECGAAALFVAAPRRRQIIVPPEEAAELRALAARVRLVAHSSYVASPFAELEAGGPGPHADFVADELRVCGAAGAAGLVVHLPARAEGAAARAALLAARAPPGVTLFLETPAVHRSDFHDPETLGLLVSQLRDQNYDCGACVDTAHLWLGGVDVAARAPAEDWIARYEAAAPGAPLCVHLNDSQRERRAGADAHAPLGRGKIWAPYRQRWDESGLAAFVEFVRRAGGVGILERKPAELSYDYDWLREAL